MWHQWRSEKENRNSGKIERNRIINENNNVIINEDNENENENEIMKMKIGENGVIGGNSYERQAKMWLSIENNERIERSGEKSASAALSRRATHRLSAK
jgi:hypothetical protein